MVNQPSAAVNADAQSAPPQLVVPIETMTPEQRFRMTARLVFHAPDVPPVEPKQRRSDLRGLDDLLDREFARGRAARGSAPSRERRSGKDTQYDQAGRDAADARDWGHDADDSGGSRRTQSQRTHDQRDADARVDRGDQATAKPDEAQRSTASTRLEVKKQRRRDQRESGRKQRGVPTEIEFLARRESHVRDMIVRSVEDRVQIAVLEDRVLVEHYVARSSETSLIGNVYLGRVQNVLPSMEAAFVDIGEHRNAVLYAAEVDWDEYEGEAAARRIEQALHPGDTVLVQATKDPVGHKGARLSSQISLPGRFLVYLPGSTMCGISRKLPDGERARLKKILKDVVPSGAGVILRTAAEGASEAQIAADVQQLAQQWEHITQRRASAKKAPMLLHAESDVLMKIVRDVFNEDFRKIVIQGSATHQAIVEYIAQIAPELLERIEKYDADELDVFDKYRISEQIVKALDRQVWLPSGGSLVIDRTEAMTVIDVNTGKFVGSGGNLEETVTKNNLEAAEECVRQLRLRDIGGIIVIDFIDMIFESNRALVLRRLSECMSRDRSKHQIAEVTSLGLVQMTRKKLGLGLLESFSETCATCAGRGLIVQREPMRRREKNSGQRGASHYHSSQHVPGAQAHTITEESRSALAKIAASTIAAGEQTQATHAEDEHAGQQRGVDFDAPAPTEAGEDAAATVSGDSIEGDLFSTILDALPAAPAPGTRRRSGRRVTSTRSVNERADSVPEQSI